MIEMKKKPKAQKEKKKLTRKEEEIMNLKKVIIGGEEDYEYISDFYKRQMKHLMKIKKSLDKYKRDKNLKEFMNVTKMSTDKCLELAERSIDSQDLCVWARVLCQETELAKKDRKSIDKIIDNISKELKISLTEAHPPTKGKVWVKLGHNLDTETGLLTIVMVKDKELEEDI